MHKTAFTVWTIGHSTRTIEELERVLLAYDIELLVDVRRFPASRRLPQFNRAVLAEALGQSEISYCWLPSLGGRRRPLPDSPNTGWRVEGFRGYADYVAASEFADGLAELVTLAMGMRTAIMCAELLWWRCHRRIIADVLVLLGATVIHIRDAEHSETHRLVSPAQILGSELRYP